MSFFMKLKELKDHELVENFSDLLIEEQHQLVLQLEYLAELDRRKLFFAHSSLGVFGSRAFDGGGYG